MKIQCPYCGSMFNDTLEECPNCGAPNANVRRKSGNQPLTIEELQQWYQERGLPPYETTRFFIGQNYKKPRAFGIYKDTNTGNFIVYKNKDSGQRAIRYEGTDEAYAVNELYQRLKQEIIQQKRANVAKGASQKNAGRGRNSGKGSNTRKGNSKSKETKYRRTPFEWIQDHYILTILLLILLSPVFLMILGAILVLINDYPSDGYYLYNDTYYYTTDRIIGGEKGVNSMYWYLYDETDQEWEGFLSEAQVPTELQRNKTAKEYYLSEDYSSTYAAPDFEDSVAYEDLSQEYTVSKGYYTYDDGYYYHLSNSSYTGWYYYDDYTEDWTSIESDEIPDELTHSYGSQDFYFTPVWDSSTQVNDFSDFTETEIYQEYQESEKKSSSKSSSWDNDDDDDDYDWSSSDSWDSSSSDWDSDW